MSNAAITVSVSPEVWQATDWQRLWHSILGTQRSWRSLAVLPGGPASPDTCLQIAVALARTGMSYLRTPIHVVDATQLDPTELTKFKQEFQKNVGQADKVVIALSSLGENRTSLPLAKAADCALLCVLMGEMSRTGARKTVAQIGAPHFVGSAVFRLHPGGAGAANAAPPTQGPQVVVSQPMRALKKP